MEHSAALSRRAHTSRVYISVSRPFFSTFLSLFLSLPRYSRHNKRFCSSLYNAGPPLSFRASDGSVFEQVLRNSRLMRRPGVQVKRIMAFNEKESRCTGCTECGPNYRVGLMYEWRPTTIVDIVLTSFFEFVAPWEHDSLFLFIYYPIILDIEPHFRRFLLIVLIF